MSNPLESIKLSQSLFQDVFFVANTQLTPYRKLRQIMLELNQLNDSIKRTEINLKRQAIKKTDLELQLRKPQSELTQNKALIELDLEELQLDESNTIRLLDDAKHRRDNFDLLKEQLLAEVPQEYWDSGFETQELAHWTKHFAKQLSISLLTGIPNAGLLEQISSLPTDMIKQVMIEAKVGSNEFRLLDQQTAEI